MNIANRLTESARNCPDQRAVIFPESRDADGRVAYTHLSFQQLEAEVDHLARGLIHLGVRPQDRLVLMVRPSLEFIALTFAAFRAGAIVVLIDPGMGRQRIFDCLKKVNPDGFLAIPIVQLIRQLKWGAYPQARFNVSVGKQMQWGGISYKQLKKYGEIDCEIPDVSDDDPAAIIFTSGSTGPPKGVLYEHGMFDAQVRLLQQHYQIQPGEIDLPGFPLFALFNAAMQVSTVIPDMDPTRPANVDPKKILEAIENQGVTQAFGSPALWNRVGRYCVEQGRTLKTVKRVLSAGAPVPVPVVETMQQTISEPGGALFTPYGATEALPVCSISSHEVIEETAEKTMAGAGTCVGIPFPEVELRIIEPVTGPIASIEETSQLPAGQVGEIIVKSPSVTKEYYLEPEATKRAKIPDGNQLWHRMGDLGYLDDQGRLWFCGRVAHLVRTDQGLLYPVQCEAIFNTHPQVYRSALVGVGSNGQSRPVLVVEPESGRFPRKPTEQKMFESELKTLGASHELTTGIHTFLFHQSLPVDRRHNVKIHREELSEWATRKL